MAPRPHTWSKFESRHDNLGHLRKDAQGWFVDIPRKSFKSLECRALDGGFVHCIHDIDGLYTCLEKHLVIYRFVIVRGMKTNLLFAYGRKGLNVDGTSRPGKWRNYRPYEAGLNETLRRPRRSHRKRRRSA